ncbi:hypothetical protein RKE29_18605 [Streptomyces sp. B1866]|uniref:hypothetical protein n=1 Tax=Streptomyces sp. B1866 TaxID=3075431 RepID=UPI002891304A|nr:hypothetical protein [Streptomyces sp. B1866]MDT3398631.1 hypothetical protein [Streptomyces sp. B1866]
MTRLLPAPGTGAHRRPRTSRWLPALRRGLAVLRAAGPGVAVLVGLVALVVGVGTLAVLADPYQS